MSDIHGNKERFESVMAQISLQPEDILYVLGDVVDRYPDGLRILRKLMAMPNVRMLLGNHEYMSASCLRSVDTDTPRSWLRSLTDISPRLSSILIIRCSRESVFIQPPTPSNIMLSNNDI